jgi:hypothetical protein
MAMSKKDWFRIVTHMIVTKDKGRRIVVNERFDPTGGSVHECKVYCTALDGRTCKETQEGPNGQIYDLGEYPVDEMLEIELTCLFGSDLRVRDENGKLWELYMDGKFCKRSNPASGRLG